MFRPLTVVTILVLSTALPLAVGAAQPAPTLAGTAWVLQEYAVQRAGLVPAVGDQRPTLVFGTDGRVNGTTGCNTYSGPYSEAGDQLTIGPLVTTLAACVDDDLARQEQVLTQVLNGPTVALTRQGSQLTLSAPAGTLVFAAADVAVQPPSPAELPQTGGPPAGLPALLLMLALLVGGFGLLLRLRTSRLR